MVIATDLFSRKITTQVAQILYEAKSELVLHCV